jgi:hypothetical protein
MPCLDVLDAWTDCVQASPAPTAVTLLLIGIGISEGLEEVPKRRSPLESCLQMYNKNFQAGAGAVAY